MECGKAFLQCFHAEWDRDQRQPASLAAFYRHDGEPRLFNPPTAWCRQRTAFKSHHHVHPPERPAPNNVSPPANACRVTLVAAATLQFDGTAVTGNAAIGEFYSRVQLSPTRTSVDTLRADPSPLGNVRGVELSCSGTFVTPNQVPARASVPPARPHQAADEKPWAQRARKCGQRAGPAIAAGRAGVARPGVSHSRAARRCCPPPGIAAAQVTHARASARAGPPNAAPQDSHEGRAVEDKQRIKSAKQL